MYEFLAKRRNCGSCFLVPDTKKNLVLQLVKMLLCEHIVWEKINLKKLLPNEQNHPEQTEQLHFMHDDHVYPHIDVFTDSIAIALQGETMGMHKVRIVSLSPKAVSKQDGIVKVPEETDCNEHL
ncbi:hypothetical protein Tsp_15235 [Trichinella spiralis]|uniref:hypothetical protein n=1 Tax=Trichinella spiralis TaxID=6334 RepID=UPI0001EFE468|nr:hypothetical protein Tsp_15235 [Trichinella spiralis]